MSDQHNILGQDMNNYTVSREELNTGLKGRTLNLEEFSHGVFLAYYKDDPNSNCFGLFGSEADIVHALIFLELKLPKKLREARDESVKLLEMLLKTGLQ